MADIRIKDLAVTAGSSASDDYLAVDGSTNGTRKLSAYSPTFGGNLTVSGKIVSSQDVQLGNTYTLTWGGAYGAGIPSIAGSTGAGSVQIYPTGSTSGPTATFTASATTLAGNLTVSGTASSSSNTAFPGAFGANGQYRLYSNSVTGASLQGQGSTYDVYIMARDGSGAITVPTGTTNVGIGGKLQLATHTTSAGGIGFGTDVSLYRQDENTLVVQPTGSSKKVLLYGDGTVSGLFNSLSSYEAIYFDPSVHSIKLATNGFTAITLDSSQNATLAGQVNILNANSYLKADSSNLVYETYAGKGHQFKTGGTTALTLDSSQNATFSGSVKAASEVYAEKSGGGIAGQSVGLVTQFTTVNSTTYNVDVGSAKVFVVQLASGDAALCYTSYKSSTITILGSDGTIVNSSSPTSGQLGIYKSANNHVVSFKTGSNALASGYASWGFCFVGNPIISISNP